MDRARPPSVAADDRVCGFKSSAPHRRATASNDTMRERWTVAPRDGERRNCPIAFGPVESGDEGRPERNHWRTTPGAMAIKRQAKPSSMLRFAASRRSEASGDVCARHFSTTTIASSTTIPMARTRPNSDRLLSEKTQRGAMKKKVPISDTGIAHESE